MQAINDILSRLKIDQLNEMQLAAIEAGKKDQDVILLSDTGSGKTLAFLLPVLQLLDPANKKTQAMIIVPSRELALQIDQVFRSMITGYKVTCCYGGHKRETEENNLLEAPALIIGTCGRIADHIRRGSIQTDSIETLVLDEFDKSIELGFQEELSYIMGNLKGLKKRILTSATDSLEIPDYIGLKAHEVLNFSTGEKAEALAVKWVKSDEDDKIATLYRLICYFGNRSTIVFCNHRESVERTSNMLKDRGITNVFYHGAMEQQERDVALCKFRNGTSNVLVTTDLAARGLDIPNIRYIVHYHLPHTEDIFTHRNGRTARMDASGTAVVILSPDEKMPAYVPADVEEIELPETAVLPESPKWSTLFIGGGKKNKINKVDIVGFLTNKGALKKEDVGLIEVKDFFSFAGIRKSRMSDVLQRVKNEKIKNQKVKIDIAK